MNNYRKLTIVFIVSISILSLSMINNGFSDLSLFSIELDAGLFPVNMEVFLRAIGTLAFPIISYLLVMDIKYKPNFKNTLIF